MDHLEEFRVQFDRDVCNSQVSSQGGVVVLRTGLDECLGSAALAQVVCISGVLPILPLFRFVV
jgi:hypothetical protein